MDVATVVQDDGKILVAGYTDRFITRYDFALARYNSDGSLDTNFGQDLDADGVRDGKITTDFGSLLATVPKAWPSTRTARSWSLA